MNTDAMRIDSHRERNDHPLTNEKEVPMQQPQPEIDYAVMEQIHEFTRKTKTLPLDLINDVLRHWLDSQGAAKLSGLGLEPLIPRFDGTAV